VVQAAGSVITQYPESLPTTPPAPACPSFTPHSEQRFTPNNSQNNRLAAPFDEENTTHILKFETPQLGEDFMAAWKRMSNTPRYTAISPDLTRFRKK
jgi:hypothetical protein